MPLLGKHLCAAALTIMKMPFRYRFLRRSMSQGPPSLASASTGYLELGSAGAPETTFIYGGRKVSAALNKSGIRWQYCFACLPWGLSAGDVESGSHFTELS